MRWARCCSALYDDHGVLHHVGVTSAFTMAMRRSLAQVLEPLRSNALDEHPWRDWASEEAHATTRMPGGQSRWSAGKDLSWEPLRIERVCEVKYDHLQGDRFRHAAHFLRWRPDKPPAGVPLRPARGHDALRVEEGFRRRGVARRRRRAAATAAGARVGSPGAFAYCGGHGASPWPSRSWRCESSSRLSSEYELRVDRAHAGRRCSRSASASCAA